MSTTIYYPQGTKIEERNTSSGSMVVTTLNILPNNIFYFDSSGSVNSSSIIVPYTAASASWAATASYVPTAREVLTTDRTYYVNTTGSDSNDGLTTGTPFLTIQKAVNVASNKLDIGPYTVIIQLSNGSYTGSVDLEGGMLYNSVYPLKIIGNTSNVNSVIVKGVAGTTPVISVNNPTSNLTISDFQLQGDAAGSHILSVAKSAVLFIGKINFSANIATARQIASYSHASIQNSGSSGYTISTGSTIHIYATQGGLVSITSVPITMSNNPNFTAYIQSQMGSVVQYNANTFNGSFTGSRYLLLSNSVLFTNGAGETYLPGTIAGTSGSGGQYV